MTPPARGAVHDHMTDRPDIAIIGPGVVGTTLGILAGRAGWPVAGVAGRDLRRARAAAEAIGPGVRAGPPDRIARGAGLVLLTVPDDAIGRVCRQLAEAGGFSSGCVAAHCSGALSSEVLSPARDRCGAAVGSVHPLQTFPAVGEAVERFAGTYCFCEGDGAAVAVLEALAEAVGARAVRLATPAKPLYHAAAVMACNYLTALLDAALEAAERAGIDRDLAAAAFEPIVRATVDNALALGPAKALTGPIARGDEALVARQLEALAAARPPLAALYRALGHRAVELALDKGTIDEKKAGALRGILSANGRPAP